MTLGIVALACFAMAIALLVRLHLANTKLDPVVDAVSDYGTTRHHRLYRAMVIPLGAGAVLLAPDWAISPMPAAWRGCGSTVGLESPLPGS